MHTLGDYISTLPTLAPGSVLQCSLFRANSASDIRRWGATTSKCELPDLNFPNIQQQFVESLFFLVLFSFDLDLCVTAGSRLTRLIVNLSPNSNPDIYHGLISVQIRVQQNWNIIEVTPNPSSIFHQNVFIWIVAVMLLCTLCRNVIMCVPGPL